MMPVSTAIDDSGPVLMCVKMTETMQEESTVIELMNVSHRPSNITFGFDLAYQLHI